MINNTKKIMIIAGQTGVGKTELAYNLARNLNGEIIVVDKIQSYKGLNITANKPSNIFTKTVKYHNLDEYDLNSNENNSALFHTNKIRKTIQEIWNNGKLPILEGGNGFYFKWLLDGCTQIFTDDEEITYQESLNIARQIIKYDSNFAKTFERLIKIDSSIKSDIRIKNDYYRLEKLLAEGIMFGNGAYQLLREREIKLRKENTFLNDVCVYRFFLFMKKFELIKNLEKRCENMIEKGLIEEVSDLIYSGKINETILARYNSTCSFLKAYGIRETVNLFFDLLKYLNNKDQFLQAYRPHSSKRENNNYRAIADKLIYNYIKDICTRHRQYAKDQANWFKYNSDNLWLNSEDAKVDYLKAKYLRMDKEEFENILKSKEILKIKEDYSNFNNSNSNNINLNSKFINFDKPVFYILQNKNKMLNLLERSFNCVIKNEQILIKMKTNSDKSNSGLVKLPENTHEHSEQIDPAILEKYLK